MTDDQSGVLYCIPPCCLICADVQFDKGFFCHNGGCDGELDVCDDFTLRDFGHPVNPVEVADELFDGYYCNYNEANAGKCANSNTLCIECFGPTTCPYLAMKKIEGVE